MPSWVPIDPEIEARVVTDLLTTEKSQRQIQRDLNGVIKSNRTITDIKNRNAQNTQKIEEIHTTAQEIVLWMTKVIKESFPNLKVEDHDDMQKFAWSLQKVATILMNTDKILNWNNVEESKNWVTSTVNIQINNNIGKK